MRESDIQSVSFCIMLIPTIKDIIALPDSAPLRAMRGKIKAVTEYRTRPDPISGQMMTVQEMFAEDPTGDINVKVANHPDLIGLVGKEVVFLATQKVKGGFTGLKRSIDQKPGFEPYPCVRVSKGATITEAAAFDAANPSEPAAIPQPDQPSQMVVQSPMTKPFIPEQASQQSVPSQSPMAEPATERQPQIGQVIKEGGLVVTTVSYGETVNTGNFCSDRMDITVQLNGTSVADGVAAIKYLLKKHLPPEFIPQGPRK